MNGSTTIKSLIKGLIRFVLLLIATIVVGSVNTLRALVSKSRRQAIIQQFDTFLQANASPVIPIISGAQVFELLKKKGMSAPIQGLEVHMAERSHGDVSTYETFLLSALVKIAAPKTLFEFGTFKGRTTHHLAANSPPDAKLWTLDLPADSAVPSETDEYDAWLIGQKGVTGQIWLNGSPALKAKITQLWGDSKSFDYASYRDRIDFIFIDANHTYSYVRSDTEHALQMLKPAGLLVWDNFDRQRNNWFHVWVNRWQNRDLNHYLFELQKSQPLYQIADTGFVIALGLPSKGVLS